jgi:hypothetical protein
MERKMAQRLRDKEVGVISYTYVSHKPPPLSIVIQVRAGG